MYAMLSSDKFGIHWQAWLVIPLVVAISALLGFLLALPSRRLVGDYLAIVTLFFGQIFYVIVTQGYRVSFLGLNTVKSLTLGLSLVDLGRSMDSGFDLVAYWQRAVYGAAASRILAAFVDER